MEIEAYYERLPSAMESNPRRLPIINCHTHIFTGDHVPPYIAKTFLVWPLYYLTSVPAIVRIFRWWYHNPYSPGKWPHQGWYQRCATMVYLTKAYSDRIRLLSLIKSLLALFLGINALFIIYYDVYLWMGGKAIAIIDDLFSWLKAYHLIITIASGWIKWPGVAMVLLLVPFIRKLVFFLLRKSRQLMGLIPSAQNLEFMKRYINLGRFALYGSQANIFKRLRNQYPPGTRFVILPMDMEFMGAGKLKEGSHYYRQMDELLEVRRSHPQQCIPFVFIDPRRIEADQNFFRYSIQDERVVLEDCILKEYIEKQGCAGFKIYPALGYHVFESSLLPLWKYAADHQVPVLTHCIRGTIFYRGRKKKEWDFHPLLEHRDGHPMLLPEIRNKDFTNNFTHPLNYLCLLEEELLRRIIAKSDAALQQLFGYSDQQTALKNDLSHFKICFGHFGGDDEWSRYFELDRDNYSSQIIRSETGIDFIHNKEGEFSMAKLDQIWHQVDWYSIIYSMMLQFPNVYADISYILHNPDIIPLLKKTLAKDEDRPDEMPSGMKPLRNRVLFGTDFYVVRNHKSEKNLLADMLAGLTEEEFDLIARGNPIDFLASTL